MKEQIKNDIISAMKAKDKFTLSVLRMLKGAIQLEEINKKQELDDIEVGLVVTKQIKSRNESIEQFKLGNRSDLIEATQLEIDLLNKYLPKQLTEEETKKIIDDSFLKLNPQTAKEKGLIMKDIMPEIKGKADMSFVNKYISEKLGN